MKKYKLKVTKPYAPVIGIMGKACKHHTDYMPIMEAMAIPLEKEGVKSNPKGYRMPRIRKKVFKKSDSK